MKNKFLITLTALMISGPVLAQEQQVYSPYGISPAAGNSDNGGYGQQSASSQSQETPNRYMTYPGREQYGDRYGYIPRHPGDYRDAVDRGQWTAGGGAQMPRRSFNGY